MRGRSMTGLPGRLLTEAARECRSYDVRGGRAVSVVGEMLALRRQITQARLDVTQELHAARTRGDQRRVDHLAGKAIAFQTILDMIDIAYQPTSDN
jgi:hypothetical protein